VIWQAWNSVTTRFYRVARQASGERDLHTLGADRLLEGDRRPNSSVHAPGEPDLPGPC
jgi:hypothetical protein